MDKSGQTIDFLLTEQRDEQAARRFPIQAIHRRSVPETITVGGSEANTAAIRRGHDEHAASSAIGRVQYLSNIVAQDHRAVRGVICPMLGVKSYEAAQRTLTGIELMPMLKKGQMLVKDGAEGLNRPNRSTP